MSALNYPLNYFGRPLADFVPQGWPAFAPGPIFADPQPEWTDDESSEEELEITDYGFRTFTPQYIGEDDEPEIPTTNPVLTALIVGLLCGGLLTLLATWLINRW